MQIWCDGSQAIDSFNRNSLLLSVLTCHSLIQNSSVICLAYLICLRLPTAISEYEHGELESIFEEQPD